MVVGQIIGFGALERWIFGVLDFHWISPLLQSRDEGGEEAGSREEGREGGMTGEGRGRTIQSYVGMM